MSAKNEGGFVMQHYIVVIQYSFVANWYVLSFVKVHKSIFTSSHPAVRKNIDERTVNVRVHFVRL